MSWQYDGKLVRVIDGDTVILELSKVFSYAVDFGFHIKEVIMNRKVATVTLRLLGLDTPELRTKDEEIKDKAIQAKNELERLLNLGALHVETTKADSFGRYLATIHVTDEKGVRTNVNRTLIEQGFAVPYTPR